MPKHRHGLFRSSSKARRAFKPILTASTLSQPGAPMVARFLILETVSKWGITKNNLRWIIGPVARSSKLLYLHRNGQNSCSRRRFWVAEAANLRTNTDMSLRDISQEESPVSGAVGNLYALAKHWEFLARDATSEEVRDAHLNAIKQLRQRLGWLENAIVGRDTKERRSEIKEVLDAFMGAGWIERYTMVDADVTYWPTEKGRNGARAYLELAKFAPRPKIPVKSEILELICGWLARDAKNTK